MTVLFWIVGVVGYLAVAVGVMRLRTWLIDHDLPWAVIEIGGLRTTRDKRDAKNFTTLAGVLWPFTLIAQIFQGIGLALVILFGFIDWAMRKLAGLPPRPGR